MKNYTLESVVSVNRAGHARGTLTVSIPAKVRKQFGVEVGDRMAVYSAPDGSMLYRKVESEETVEFEA